MPQRATFKVPRLYKAAAKVASVIKNENGNLEQLVEQYNKKTNAKALGALVSKIVKNEDILNKIIENSEILVKEPKEDPWLFRVLIAELLLGKQRLPIGSKTIQTVLSYGPILRTELMRAQGKPIGKLKKSKSILEYSENSASDSTKIKKSETAELGLHDKNAGTGMKSKKRKQDDVQTTMEENLLYEPKKVKKSKKRKDNREIVPDVNEDHTVDEYVDINEQLPNSSWDDQQEYSIMLEDDNSEPTSVEHNKKKKKKNRRSSENSTHKKTSANSKIKSESKREKKKKSKKSSSTVD